MERGARGEGNVEKENNIEEVVKMQYNFYPDENGEEACMIVNYNVGTKGDEGQKQRKTTIVRRKKKNTSNGRKRATTKATKKRKAHSQDV